MKASECDHQFPDGAVDYEAVTEFKRRLLGVAWVAFKLGVRKDLVPGFQEFCRKNQSWLRDYALFRALKARFSNVSYLEWPEDLVKRRPAAMSEAKRVGGPDRARVVFAVPAFPAGGATQAIRSLERYRLDWRSALLCFAGFERCMGQS